MTCVMSRVMDKMAGTTNMATTAIGVRGDDQGSSSSLLIMLLRGKPPALKRERVLICLLALRFREKQHHGDLEGLEKRVEEVVSVKWRGGLGCAWTQRGGARHEGGVMMRARPSKTAMTGEVAVMYVFSQMPRGLSLSTGQDGPKSASSGFSYICTVI